MAIRVRFTRADDPGALFSVWAPTSRGPLLTGWTQRRDNDGLWIAKFTDPRAAKGATWLPTRREAATQLLINGGFAQPLRPSVPAQRLQRVSA